MFHFRLEGTMIVEACVPKGRFWPNFLGHYTYVCAIFTHSIYCTLYIPTQCSVYIVYLHNTAYIVYTYTMQYILYTYTTQRILYISLHNTMYIVYLISLYNAVYIVVYRVYPHYHSISADTTKRFWMSHGKRSTTYCTCLHHTYVCIRQDGM